MSNDRKIQFREMSYDQFLAHVETIAHQVEEDSWKPDYIVGIGRGGLVPGTYLSHRLEIPLLSIDHSSKVHVFSDALLVHLASCTQRGERFLFIDDINDSGKTLARFRSLIEEHDGELSNFRFSVLINNVSSRATVHYESETIDRQSDKSWFIFPWGSVASRAAQEWDAREDPERLGLTK
ncbi:Phosphoribosyltransferase [Sphingomonas paucimobilis]|nr:Phosphoribosyltransferase [Sphingomonas paucimobilis]